MHTAKATFATSTISSTRLFFTCLNPDGGTAQSKWLKGVKHNMRRVYYDRVLEGGEREEDQSATPLYNEHMVLLAIALQGSNKPGAKMNSFISPLLPGATVNGTARTGATARAACRSTPPREASAPAP